MYILVLRFVRGRSFKKGDHVPVDEEEHSESFTR